MLEAVSVISGTNWLWVKGVEGTEETDDEGWTNIEATFLPGH